MTRHRFDSASTAGRIHSQRPWIPGTSTTGVPDPLSMIFIASYRSVAQFLSGLPVFNVC